MERTALKSELLRLLKIKKLLWTSGELTNLQKEYLNAINQEIDSVLEQLRIR